MSRPDVKGLFEIKALSRGERMPRPGVMGLFEMQSPLPWGEGAEGTTAGEGSLSSPPRTPHQLCCFAHFSDKSVRVLGHQPIRQPEHAHANLSKVRILRCILFHLAGLRVDASIEFHGQAELAAIKINDVIFDGILAAEFQAQAPASQQMPGRLFSSSLRVAQFANALGAGSHV